MDSLDPRGNKSLNGNNRSHKRLILAKNHLSKSNNLDNPTCSRLKQIHCSYFLVE